MGRKDGHTKERQGEIPRELDVLEECVRGTLALLPELEDKASSVMAAQEPSRPEEAQAKESEPGPITTGTGERIREIRHQVRHCNRVIIGFINRLEL